MSLQLYVRQETERKINKKPCETILFFFALPQGNTEATITKAHSLCGIKRYIKRKKVKASQDKKSEKKKRKRI